MAKKSTKKEAEAKVEKKTDDVEVVESSKEGELVLAEGVGLDLWESSKESFLPQLKKEMSLAERKKTIRDCMKEAVQIDDKLNLVAGELLWEASKNGYWKEWEFTDDKGETRPYASFEEYTENELNMKRRKAFYLIKIYDKFIVELKLSSEELAGLQWSKAREIADVITPDNYKEVIERVSTMPVTAVKDYVKELKGKKPIEGDTTGVTEGGGKEPEETVKLNFKLYPEQAENVKNALSIAETMTGSEKPGNQLDLICSEFVAGAVGMGLEGALAKLELVVKNVERAFGVKLSIEDIDSERYSKMDETSEEETPAESE